MPETIAAVYENGVFRPLSPLSLNDGETVQITIVAEVSQEELKGDREKAIKLMNVRKLMGLPTKQFKLDAAAEQKRRELFEKLKGRVGKPLSEIVIEDRGPW
ncbi:MULTISPECIES: antitoxin family protein [unclassified Microcoleus]|uniref:antitoxin family protein n=1 Tax=unclassified Microcoleus TaxID=2642155 RepID=UPI002FD0E312